LHHGTTGEAAPITTGVHFIGVYLIGTHLMDTHLMGVHFMCHKRESIVQLTQSVEIIKRNVVELEAQRIKGCYVTGLKRDDRTPASRAWPPQPCGIIPSNSWQQYPRARSGGAGPKAGNPLLCKRG
jgi:hypothetical protein